MASSRLAKRFCADRLGMGQGRQVHKDPHTHVVIVEDRLWQTRQYIYVITFTNANNLYLNCIIYNFLPEGIIH
jgi:hypothetical protein